MTPEAAIHNFMSSFGIPAYSMSSTPDDARFPYITYNLVIGDWAQGSVIMPVNVWYRSDSESEPNAKVREIADAIGHSGVTLPCDRGMVWVKIGSPWSQNVLGSDSDAKIKRRYLNVYVDYLVV